MMTDFDHRKSALCDLFQIEIQLSTVFAPIVAIVVHTLGVGSYLKLGGQLVMWGHNLPPLFKIGLTDLPKHEWAHPAPPVPTALNYLVRCIRAP